MSFGLPELIIILVIVLILFGGTRLPKLARSVGESMRELREGFVGREKSSKAKRRAAKKDETNI